MNKKEILQAAFNEGTKHIEKKSDDIYSLAEEYVQNQPMKIWHRMMRFMKSLLKEQRTVNNSI